MKKLPKELDDEIGQEAGRRALEWFRLQVQRDVEHLNQDLDRLGGGDDIEAGDERETVKGKETHHGRLGR